MLGPPETYCSRRPYSIWLFQDPVVIHKHLSNHQLALGSWRLHADSSCRLDTTSPLSQGSLGFSRELSPLCVPLTTFLPASGGGGGGLFWPG